MDIPAPLKESVETGNAILLLGAGASLSANDSGGKSPPKSQELASLLAHNFVSPDYATASLVQVADFAISETSLFQVQDFLREVYLPFRPSENHKLLPSFRWPDLSIPRDAIVSSVRVLLPPFDRIQTGYSTYSESCTDTVALGRNDNVVVFAEHNAEDILQKLWLTLDVYTSEDASIALKAFAILSQWPLILADWGWSVLIRIADSPTLSAYLDHRVKAFEEVARKMNAKDDS